MKLFKIILILMLFFCDSIFSDTFQKFILPDVTIEALYNGSFRAYIPDSNGIKFFSFHGNLNKPVIMQDPGDYSLDTFNKTGDFWIASFPNAHVKVGDRINYWIFCHVKSIGYGRDGLTTTIKKLLIEYPLLESGCVKASTVTNGRETCIKEVILDEQFSAPTIRDSKWLVEQSIPTYKPPSFFFNCHADQGSTSFITDGILYLKPTAYNTDDELRGTLELRNGCTSIEPKLCLMRSISWFFLPPAQSANIISKVSFKYGKVDIRAKFPAGKWLVPVIQLEQKDKENSKSSPVIWAAYSRGNDQLSNVDQDIGADLLLAGPVLYHFEAGRKLHLVLKHSPHLFNEEFHTFSVVWMPGQMTFSVDNTQYSSVDLTNDLGADIDSPEAPYNKEYVLSLGVAVGGLVDFTNVYASAGTRKSWPNNEPRFIKKFFEERSTWFSSCRGNSAALQVDYVKITAF